MPLIEIADSLNPIEEIKRLNTDAGFSAYPLGINGMGDNIFSEAWDFWFGDGKPKPLTQAQIDATNAARAREAANLPIQKFKGHGKSGFVSYRTQDELCRIVKRRYADGVFNDVDLKSAGCPLNVTTSAAALSTQAQQSQQTQQSQPQSGQDQTESGGSSTRSSKSFFEENKAVILIGAIALAGVFALSIGKGR